MWNENATNKIVILLLFLCCFMAQASKRIHIEDNYFLYMKIKKKLQKHNWDSWLRVTNGFTIVFYFKRNFACKVQTEDANNTVVTAGTISKRFVRVCNQTFSQGRNYFLWLTDDSLYQFLVETVNHKIWTLNWFFDHLELKNKKFRLNSSLLVSNWST